MKKIVLALLFSIISTAVFSQVTWKKANSSKYKVSFEYPSNWSYEETEEGIETEGIVLGNDNNPAGFMLYYSPMQVEFANTYDNLQLFFDEFKKGAVGLNVVDTLVRTTINGLEAIEVGAEQTDETGTMYVKINFVLHNKGIYMLFYGDDRKQFKASYDNYLGRMVKSFKFIE